MSPTLNHAPLFLTRPISKPRSIRPPSREMPSLYMISNSATRNGGATLGSRTRVRVVKNKVAPPFRVAEFDIMYIEGISREGGLIDHGLEMGLVKKSGAWFNVGDIRLGQGRENAKDFLRQNSDVAAALEEQIRGNISSFKAGEVELETEEDEEPVEES